MSAQRGALVKRLAVVGVVNLAVLLFLAALLGLSYLQGGPCDRDHEGALKASSSWNPVKRCVCAQVRPYECGWVGVDR